MAAVRGGIRMHMNSRQPQPSRQGEAEQGCPTVRRKLHSYKITFFHGTEMAVGWQTVGMRLPSEALGRDLQRSLGHAYLVAGGEPLLVEEATDAIRAAARAQGFTGRDVFVVDRGFDWGAILQETQAMSLFADKRILEIRLPSPKPGVEGAKILGQLAARPTPDFLILVITGGLDWAERKAAWVKAFDDAAVFVDIEQVAVERLPAWITQRLRGHGLEPEEGAAELLAERCEGNLVAAHQEIARLALVLGGAVATPQSLSVDAVSESVARSARFTLLQLGEAALAGEPERALRVLEGLRGEGEEPTLVLWTLAEEIRAVLQFNPNADRGAPMRTWRGGPRRQRALAQAAKRLGRERARLYQMLQFAGQTDLIVKGLRAGDAWGAFAQLTAALSGAPVSLPVASGVRSSSSG